MPPIDNPELALVLAGVPDSLAQSGGDLYATIINVAVNAWMAGHIHGEDGCTGCECSRGRLAGLCGRGRPLVGTLARSYLAGEGAGVSVRYYLYISDAKADMLLSQIDPAWGRKRVTELSLGLTVAGVKRSVETHGADRVARLERVLRHLEDHADLGHVDEPGQYVHGVLPMQWGAIGDGGTVYFGGRSEHTVVGLGGSAEHLLGTVAAAPPEQSVLSASLPPVLLNQLAALAPQDAAADPEALATVLQANATLRGPTQTVEFVAKRMLHGPCPYPELYPPGTTAVLLASPLFVALSE
ncbi:DUF7019 family protein [Streptomyces sp. WC2508]|uniref:DUF7019 family protein n=1 Tax=Streptomyces sp. WC2508 TaxID=3461405 RepID=UPI004043E3CF